MSIAKHTTYNLLGSVVPMAVTLITVPLYLKAIGVERYGVLALCWAMLGYMGFLNLGLGQALSQRVAFLRNAPPGERADVFWTAFWLNALMGLVGGLLLFFLARFYFGFAANVPAAMRAEVDGAIPWLAGIIPMVMLSGVLSGALQGREQFLAVNLISASMSTLMSLAPLMVAYLWGPDIGGLIASALLVRFLSLCLLFALCVRKVPLSGAQGPVGPLVKPLLKFGGWVTVSSILSPLVVTIDRFAIGATLGAAAVSAYVVPYNLVARITVIPQSLQSALFPRFAYLDAEKARRLQVEALAALSTIMTPLIIGMIAVVGPFLHVWVGSRLGAQSTPVAYILLIGWWANSYARVPYSLLQAQGRPDLITKVLLIYLLPYIGLLYLGLSNWGVMGAAIAWAARSTFDPVCFFILTKAQKLLPRLIWPGLLVYAAVAVALLFPTVSWERWLLHGGIFIVAGVSSIAGMPPVMWERVEALTGRLPFSRLLGRITRYLRRLSRSGRLYVR